VDTIDRWLVMPLRPYGATDAVDALRLRASQRERRRFATAVVSLAQHVSRAERDLTLRLRLAFAEALIDPQRMPGVAGELIRRRERRRPGTIAGIAVYLAYLCEQA
jgi:hypothetical protein